MSQAASAGSPEATRASVALRRSTAAALAGGAIALAWVASMAGLAPALGGAGTGFALKALAVYALACIFVWRALPAHVPHTRFGPANLITLARLLLIAMLAAVLGERVPDADALAWAVLTVASVAALMDAVDGPIARRRGEASEFGARFDMESDALLVLVLSALAWQLGKAGAWVLAAGAMRYLFVAAAWRWPWLAQPLPPRWRRKAVCVVQIVSLILCLCPWLQPPLSVAVAAVGLAALTASFGLDVFWLFRHRNTTGELRA